MSAQPSDQIGGSTPTSSLFRSLRGSFSQRSVAVGGSAEDVTSVSTTTATPVSAPTPVPGPTPIEDVAAAPIELDQLAQEVTENISEEPSALPVADVPEVVSQETFEDAAPVVETPIVEAPIVEAPEQLEPAQETSVLAAALPSAVNEMTDTLNPPMAGGGMAKEAPLLSVTVEHPAVDQAGGVQYVETEKSHELPPDVEGFIKTVEDNIDQIPQEVVISDPQSGQQLPRVLATPVIVLPITPKTEDEGKRKSETYSIRWLIEWSWKMMKTFSGKVVYRDESSES